MMIRSFLCAAVVLGLAVVASANGAGFIVGLDYYKSYAAPGITTPSLATTPDRTR